MLRFVCALGGNSCRDPGMRGEERRRRFKIMGRGKCCKAEEFEKGIAYVTREMNVFNTSENDSPWVR